MSTMKKLDRTQVELFNFWKPHQFQRAPARRYPDVRRTMSQLGPRPSDFIVAPDWVSEDADMTHAFGKRSHRPWNFEFPGARNWPRDPPEVEYDGPSATGRAAVGPRRRAGDVGRPRTTSGAVADGAQATRVRPGMAAPSDGPPPVGAPRRQTRYRPFLEALGTRNYRLTRPEPGRAAFSRYFDRRGTDSGTFRPARFTDAYDSSKTARHAM